MSFQKNAIFPFGFSSRIFFGIAAKIIKIFETQKSAFQKFSLHFLQPSLKETLQTFRQFVSPFR
jgi:hypothetical protein